MIPLAPFVAILKIQDQKLRSKAKTKLLKRYVHSLERGSCHCAVERLLTICPACWLALQPNRSRSWRFEAFGLHNFNFAMDVTPRRYGELLKGIFRNILV
jgi:hypothetical protein